MTSEVRAADVGLLGRFWPLAGMRLHNQVALAAKVQVRRLDPGRILFQEGDAEARSYWLVSGSIELFQQGRLVGGVASDTPAARNPLCPDLPRSHTARAAGEIEYLVIDSELLDLMVTWDQTGTYEVADLQSPFEGAGDSDWMSTLLRNRALQRLPASNLQALFLRMERVPVKAGEVLIHQGAPGDWFYVMVSGRCVVKRETPLNRDGIKLAEFSAGDSFGEEALISDAPRSATVTMRSDGVVMRLHKHDFLELLGAPLIERIPHAEALQRVAEGGTWLDVRLPAEFQSLAIDGAVNIPLYFLRLKMSALDPGRQYIVYCGDGRRSAAAAFILAERGFAATVLDHGITAVDSGLRRTAEA